MAYKVLYIDDLETESRLNDIIDLGYEAKLYNPTSDLTDLFNHLEEDTRACVLDYRLTKGINNACFDAPTIAQTLRTKHKNDLKDFPLILMSNETIKVQEYDKDLTSQDLFDFVLTKEEFTNAKIKFKQKLDSFINAYNSIMSDIKISGRNTFSNDSTNYFIEGDTTYSYNSYLETSGITTNIEWSF